MPFAFRRGEPLGPAGWLPQHHTYAAMNGRSSTVTDLARGARSHAHALFRSDASIGRSAAPFVGAVVRCVVPPGLRSISRSLPRAFALG